MCNNSTIVSTKSSIFKTMDIEVSYSNNIILSKYDKIYIKSVLELSKLSYCIKLQVGCIITKDNRIISNGYNGTLSKTDNNCEELVNDIFKTKISVFHAEENAIYNMLRNGISTVNCTLYCTHSPCIHCAKTIIGSGINKVVFINYYKDINGISLLKQYGIETIRIIDIFDN